MLELSEMHEVGWKWVEGLIGGLVEVLVRAEQSSTCDEEPHCRM